MTVLLEDLPLEELSKVRFGRNRLLKAAGGAVFGVITSRMVAAQPAYAATCGDASPCGPSPKCCCCSGTICTCSGCTAAGGPVSERRSVLERLLLWPSHHPVLRLVDGSEREMHMQEDNPAVVLGLVGVAPFAGLVLGLTSGGAGWLAALVVVSAILAAVAQQTLP